jgi:hypothetical protein
MTDPLGPFQAIWNAWDEVDTDLKDKPLTHFERAVEIQFEELRTHLAHGDREAAAREAVDVISIALNMLRWLKYRPEDVARVAESRGEHRMRGQVAAILEHYRTEHGI